MKLKGTSRTRDSNRTTLGTKSTRTREIRRTLESMSTTLRIRPRKSQARTAARLIARTVKGRKTLKSAAHPNRERGQRTEATANCCGFFFRSVTAPRAGAYIQSAKTAGGGHAIIFFYFICPVGRRRAVSINVLSAQTIAFGRGKSA